MITTIDTPTLSHSHFKNLESFFSDSVIDTYLYKKYCEFVEQSQEKEDKQLVAQMKTDVSDAGISFSAYKQIHGL